MGMGRGGGTALDLLPGQRATPPTSFLSALQTVAVGSWTRTRFTVSSMAQGWDGGQVSIRGRERDTEEWVTTLVRESLRVFRGCVLISTRLTPETPGEVAFRPSN